VKRRRALKGVVLVGGTGSRLNPITTVTNKHLLPVYDRPMVYYPLQALINAGVTEAMIVTGGNNAGDFLRLLGDGSKFGFERLHYAYQEEAGGIAQALGLAETFAGDDGILVILGDNIIETNIRDAAKEFELQDGGAKLILTEVSNPSAYGVAQLENGRIIGIEEKPENPISNLVAIGIYFYGSEVFDVIKTLEPSGRGELEITDVNNHFIRAGSMTHSLLKGYWADCGESIDSYLEAINLIARKGANDRALCP
jgi:glucose-1-phosphate thymidylyltransferase